jgi:hypothetical protein
MDYIPDERLYEDIQTICLKSFDREAEPDPFGLLREVWENIDFPMHCPEHHYLVPAVLLTVYRRLKKDGGSSLKMIWAGPLCGAETYWPR